MGSLRSSSLPAELLFLPTLKSVETSIWCPTVRVTKSTDQEREELLSSS
jgi:hypothetical protein